MSKHRVQLDEIILEDLTKVIATSPLLKECYEGLPDDQREHVDDMFLNLMWDTILSGAMGRSYDGNPNRSSVTEILTAAIPKARARK